MGEGTNHQLVGRGSEHRVYQSNVREDRLIKVPTLRGQTYQRVKGGAPAIREEFKRARKMVEGTTIQVPRTRVFKAGDGYVMEQQKIEPDPNATVEDIRREIEQYRDRPELVATFQSNHDNFIRGTDGVTYWIDPTNGMIPALEKVTRGIVSRERYRKAKALYKRFRGR